MDRYDIDQFAWLPYHVREFPHDVTDEQRERAAELEAKVAALTESDLDHLDLLLAVIEATTEVIHADKLESLGKDIQAVLEARGR